MKNTIIRISLAFLLALCSQLSFAQCNKNFMLESSTTNFLDSAGKVTRSQQKPVDVSLQDSVLTVQFGDNQDQILTGKISKATCSWKTPFKEGKMVLSAVLKNASGTLQTANPDLQQ